MKPREEVHFQVWWFEDGEPSYRVAPEGYSKFYENELRYNFDDAKAHIDELMKRHPNQKFVIIKQEIKATIVCEAQ